MLKWGILPKCAGWYWVRGRKFEPTMCKVFESKASGMLCCILPDGAKMAMDFDDYDWAGPVPEPV